MNEPRFRTLALEELDPEQRAIADRMIAGQRGVVRGPYNALLRSPELCDRAERMGEYVRFKSSIGEKLKELAIMITTRHWGATFAWSVHRGLAEKAGLDPTVGDAIEAGRRPPSLSAEETAVCDFCTALLAEHDVDDATYEAIVSRFGERGVVDLVYTIGHYCAMSLILKVDRYPPPPGVAPLKKL